MMAEILLDPARHEPRDVGGRFIGLGVLALVAAVVVPALLVLWLFSGATIDQTIRRPLPQYPGPELQVDPARDMRDLESRQLRTLNGTGWVDRARGIAHIPIDQAMQLIARDGLPDWPKQAGHAP